MNEESFFVPPFPLRAEETDRSKKRAQLTFRKAQQHAKENRIKGYRASVKKGGPPRSSSILERDQIHAYLEAFALLIKGGPRPRASKRRAAKKRGTRGRRQRLFSCALPPSLLLSGNAKDRRVHVCLPFFYERYETKRGAPLLCKFMRAQVSRETATTHIGYWVIGYTSVLVSSCTVNPAREH